MSLFFAKIAGMVLMCIDHAGVLFQITSPIPRIIGRSGFFLFAYFFAQGWRHTSDRSAYFNRLCFLAVISQAPYCLLHPEHFDASFDALWAVLSVLLAGMAYFIVERKKDALWPVLAALVPCLDIHVGNGLLMHGYCNVIYTFLLAALIITAVEHKNNICIKVILLLAVVRFGLFCDYTALGSLLCVGYYYAKDRTMHLGLTGTVWAFVMYYLLSDSVTYFLGSMAGVCLICLIDPAKGPAPKRWRTMYYWFYPAHILILYVIGRIFGLGA